MTKRSTSPGPEPSQVPKRRKTDAELKELSSVELRELSNQKRGEENEYQRVMKELDRKRDVAKKLIQSKLISHEAFKKSDYHGKACFTNYALKGCFDEWRQAIETFSCLRQVELIYHEFVPRESQVKPYLDIDWAKEQVPGLDPEVVIENVVHAVIYILEEEWGIIVTEKDIYVCSCHRNTKKGYKYSFHLVVTTLVDTLVFNNTTSAKHFARRVSDVLTEQISEYAHIIDLNPYKVNQNFRLLGHHKRDETEPFQVVPGYGLDAESASEATSGVPELLHTLTWFPGERHELYVPEQSDSLINLYAESSNHEFGTFTGEEVTVVDGIVKGLHATAHCVNERDAHNFMQWNYTDKTEPCFVTGLTHDQIGFFVFQKNKDIYAGCHSARCNHENGKKIIQLIGSLNFQTIADQVEPVTLEQTHFKIPYHIIERAVCEENVGICNLFYEMFGRVRRIKSTPGKMSQTYLWNGELWEEDESNVMYLLLSTTVPRVLEDFKRKLTTEDTASQVTLQNDHSEAVVKQVDELVSRLRKMKDNEKLLKAVKAYTNDPKFTICKDVNPGTLSVKNGILDLKTGNVRPACPEDMITKRLEVEYDASADDSLMDQFIWDITSDTNGRRPDLYNYFRWAVGYIIQGQPVHKKFFVLYGPYGNNGKSLFCELLINVLEHYVVPMDQSVVFEAPQKSQGAASPEILHLRHAHVGYIADTSKNNVINDMRMKMFTGGGDKISIRGLYSSPITMELHFVPVIATNHRFKVNANDPAMKNRMVVIPFELSFVNKPTKSFERQGDQNLKEKLLADKQGILKWFIECSVKWYHAGPVPALPNCVVREIDEYYIAMDALKHFESKIVMYSPGSETTLEHLFDLYKRFHESNSKQDRVKGRNIIRDYFKETYKYVDKKFIDMKTNDAELES